MSAPVNRLGTALPAATSTVSPSAASPPTASPPTASPSVAVGTVLDLLPDPALLVDRAGRVQRVNAPLAALLGLRPAALAGRMLADLSAGPAAALDTYLRRCSGSLQPLPGVLDLTGPQGTPPGTTVRLRCDGCTVRLGDGRPGPLLLRCRPPRVAMPEFALLTEKVRQLGHEVRARRRVEAELRRSEERLRLAAEATGLGTWDHDPLTGRLDWSDRCKALFGLPPDAEVDLPLFLFAVHPDDRPRVEAAMARALDPTGDGAYDIAFRVVGIGDGVERCIATTGRCFFADGRAVRFIGTALDVTERMRAEDLQRLLINELDHRVKNTLSSVQSIARQTARHTASLAEFRTAFEARLTALSNTHNLLTRTKWRGADLQELLESELAPYGGTPGEDRGEDRGEEERGRVRLSGPPVRLDARATVALGLAVHELATNAAKHGALSRPAGRVAIGWRLDSDAAGPRLCLGWRESGGPPVTPPTRRGFGSRLIERGLAYDLNGTVSLTYDPAGVRCRIDVPLSPAERAEHD